jgi:hypothetical protein
VKDMRRRLALLTTSTALVVGAAVVGAAPAQARNIGGTVPEGAVCVAPGEAAYGNPDSGLPCACFVLLNKSVIRNVGRGPDTGCPTSIHSAP